MSVSALRVLLTGGRGFVGKKLVSRLAEVHPAWRLEAPAGPDAAGASAVHLDVTDQNAVESWIKDNQPDVVINLAAVSAVSQAMKDPRRAWDVNLGGTLNLILAVRAHAPSTYFMQISSSEVYGVSAGREGASIDEGCLLQPTNAYAASKAAADLLTRQAAAEGLSATVLRPFNHTGPGQTKAFVAPAFAEQIARIEAGLQEPILKVGSLDDERDFLDVEDVVAAYQTVLDTRARLENGLVFNIASGVPVRIGDMLETLLGLARTPVKVETDPARLRNDPPRRIVGNASLLQAKTQWSPRSTLRDALARLLDERREILKSA